MNRDLQCVALVSLIGLAVSIGIALELNAHQRQSGPLAVAASPAAAPVTGTIRAPAGQ